MKKIYVLPFMVAVMSLSLLPAPAHATIADLFAAVDLAAVSTGVMAVLTAVIGIALLFVGFSYVRKALPGKK
jgi:hypothetical protein